MNKRTIIRYSEAFKIEVVRCYEESGLTKREVKEKYGILGAETVTIWLRKYGKPSSQNRIIRVEKPNESNEIRKLKKEIDDLKKALGESHIKQVTTKNLTEAACELMGITVEELKKKSGKKS